MKWKGLSSFAIEEQPPPSEGRNREARLASVDSITDTRSVAVGLLIDVFEKDLECASAMPGVDLCPMYSVGWMEQ